MKPAAPVTKTRGGTCPGRWLRAYSFAMTSSIGTAEQLSCMAFLSPLRRRRGSSCLTDESKPTAAATNANTKNRRSMCETARGLRARSRVGALHACHTTHILQTI